MHMLQGEGALFMEFKHNRRTVHLREEGASLVRAVFCYPSTDTWNLYGDLAKNAEEWIRVTLAPRATEEYRADPSPKKHFFFPAYEYRFEVEILSQSERELVCTLTVTLARQKSTLAQSTFTDRFRAADLAFLPPKKHCRTKSKIRHKRAES